MSAPVGFDFNGLAAVLVAVGGLIGIVITGVLQIVTLLRQRAIKTHAAETSAKVDAIKSDVADIKAGK